MSAAYGNGHVPDPARVRRISPPTGRSTPPTVPDRHAVDNERHTKVATISKGEDDEVDGVTYQLHRQVR